METFAVVAIVHYKCFCLEDAYCEKNQKRTLKGSFLEGSALW